MLFFSRKRGWAWFVVALVWALIRLGLHTSSSHDRVSDSDRGIMGVMPAATPPIGRSKPVEPGIVLYDVSLPRLSEPLKLKIYLPTQSPKGKLPVVLIAPAGTRLFHGTTLGDGDSPEHLPYARAGYAVVAYEIDGDLPENPTDAQLVTAAKAFKDAEAGVANARAALDYALGKVPNLDPKRVYTAGHSSAATLSLLVAENDPRIAACIAYAPCCDLKQRLGSRIIEALERVMPDYAEFVQRSSPLENTARLKCPVFLFHADDDGNVPLSDNTAFVEKLKQTNPKVTFVRVPTGNHYDSMIEQGIPRAIAWLKTRPAR